MAAVQHFRSAFNGFNREDVVSYIEYLNNQHNSQIEQLNNQLQNALAKTVPTDESHLQEQLDAALAKVEELEQKLAQQPESGSLPSSTDEELEAYRRAERAERIANERAQQIYAQANAVLADATAKAETVSRNIDTIADQVSAQLQEYRNTVIGTKDTFQEAVAALAAIRPEE